MAPVAGGVLAYRVRRWFTSRKAVQRLRRGSGAVMIGAGLAVIASE